MIRNLQQLPTMHFDFQPVAQLASYVEGTIIFSFDALDALPIDLVFLSQS